ncbi:MAG: hypothetical protein ACYTHM_14290 [Planctomycetota bacterium]|jgi:hypothetical protein
MNDDVEVIEKRINLKWVRGGSGTTYLCPVRALDRIDNPSEAQLKLICVDESLNPQND